MKKLMVGVLALGGLLAACSADETDFKESAEKAIRGDIESNVEGDAEADCDEPDDTEVGTSFNCVGTDANGDTYNYVATITGKKEVTVSFVGIGEPATEEPAEEESES